MKFFGGDDEQFSLFQPNYPLARVISEATKMTMQSINLIAPSN
jgi:hypothetical protein